MIKYRITKMNADTFFLKVGATVFLNPENERVYSADKKQHMPISVALKLGMEGVPV